MLTFLRGRRGFYGLLLLTTALVASCGSRVPVLEQATRTYVNERVEPFIQLVNEASLPVYVYPSETATRVEILAPPALLETILVEHRDERLTIKFSQQCAYVKIASSPTIVRAVTESPEVNAKETPKNNPECLQLQTDRSPQINIYTPEFQNLTNAGVGPVYVAGVTTPKLRVVNRGGGDIEFTAPVNLDSLSVRLEGGGNVEFTAQEANDLQSASFTNQGTGTILADNVRVEGSTVQLLGEGDIYTFTTEQVEGSVSGPGTLYLNGDPDTSRLQQIGLNKVVEQGQ